MNKEKMIYNEIVEEENLYAWKLSPEWERTNDLKQVFIKYYDDNFEVKEYPVLQEKWINNKTERVRWTDVEVEVEKE